MIDYKNKISKNWTPTFENVTREFIEESLYRILFNENQANLRFNFQEKEAIDYIEQILKNYGKKYNCEERTNKVIDELKNVENTNTDKPIMIVNDYKKFFEYLRQIYEKDIELYFLRTNYSFFSRYEKNNCFEQIWLRMTPDDFNNPEEFLKKQAQMLNDTTFKKYNNQTYFGEVDSFAICVKNGIARTWDENFKQIEIVVYDKTQYKNVMESDYQEDEIVYFDDRRSSFLIMSKEEIKRRELKALPHYILPLIRYGIYEKDGKKICYIGSVQNKKDNHKPNEMDKRVNKTKYKANEGIEAEDTEKVEPKNLLSLSIFINMLNNENINEIEVPSLYVLDYEFHKKLSKEMIDELAKEWPEEKIKLYPEEYKAEKESIDTLCDKEDLISELKTERLQLAFRRLLLHYPKGHISSYPGELDSFMHITIPKIKDENDINGSIFKRIYKMQEQNDMER